MANIKILGDAVVITSAVKFEDIRTIEKYNKDALTLKVEEEGKMIPVFGVATGKTGEINQYGATFASATRDEDGFATITICIKDLGEDVNVKDWVADKFGKAILNLNKVEATIPEVLEKIAEEKAEILDNIAVVQ